MAVVFLAIGARLVDLQALDANHYARLGFDQRVHTVQLAAQRGSIFDRNGQELAISVPQETVWADPRVISDPAGYASTLARITGVNRAALQRRLSQPNLAFVYVARKVSPDIAKRVMDLKLPGVGTTPESKRFYPSGSVAASVLGETGLDNQGLFGLEAGYDSILAGTPGKAIIEQDPRGREIPSTKQRGTPAVSGRDLVLTVDQTLQYETEQILLKEATLAKAKHATAIVADVRTGDVLAMATVDGPTTSSPAQVAAGDERNRPLTDVFEPGSTNKIIPIAGALEDGAVKPDETFVIPGEMSVGGKPYKDDEAHGTETMSLADIMAHSSNIGTIKIAQALGKVRFDHYLHAFGLGQQTSVLFPGQQSGIVLPLANYNSTSMGSMPIGQGIAVTSMQMLDAYLTIANGGVSVNPRLVEATLDANGQRHDIPIERAHRVVSAGTADTVKQLLTSVVTEGTGTGAAIPGYTIAGKTGTARKPPYNLGQHVASFVGFAPVDSPRLAVSVVIDEPQNLYYGGQIAAPAFAGIMWNALRMERVPPVGGVADPPPAFQGQPDVPIAPLAPPTPPTTVTSLATPPTTGPAPRPGAATSPTTARATAATSADARSAATSASTTPTTVSTGARAGPAGTLAPASPSG
ncbi:MAG TPA: penicillin-binding protein 2 [Acidimicrobiia bacterium]